MTVQLDKAVIRSDQTSVRAQFVGDRRWMIPAFRGRYLTLEQAVVAIQLAEALEARSDTTAEPSCYWPDLNLWASQLGMTVREAAAVLGFPNSSAPVLSLYSPKLATTSTKRRWRRWLQS